MKIRMKHWNVVKKQLVDNGLYERWNQWHTEEECCNGQLHEAELIEIYEHNSTVSEWLKRYPNKWFVIEDFPLKVPEEWTDTLEEKLDKILNE